MKKYLIYLSFTTVFLISLVYLLFNINKIDTNIYSLISFDNSKIISNINSNLSDNIIFLFDNESNIDLVNKYNSEYQIFESVNSGLSNNYDKFIDELNQLKIATLSRDIVNQLDNASEFFYNKSNEMLNSFTPKINSLKNDFFLLSNDSNLLNNNSNFKYDIENDRMYTVYDNVTYYFIQGKLKDKYNPSDLLEFVSKIKKETNNRAIISGGALFNADGHKSGLFESIYMSILSITLSALILLISFKQKSILILLSVIVFALSLGVSACVLFFNEIHVLSIIVSASLVGLILDFPIHFLSKYNNNVLKADHIKPLIPFLFINFLITGLGYLLFLFSGMALLKQIAVISIVTLFASLLYTIYFIPNILSNKVYSESNIFKVIFKYYNGLLNIISKRSFLFLLLSFIIIVIGSYKIIVMNSFSDNVRNYSSISEDFLNDTILTSKITNFNNPSNFFVMDNYSIDREVEFISKLTNNDFIDSYKGLSNIFLGEMEQNHIKDKFKESSSNIDVLNSYLNLGIDKNHLESEFEKIYNSKTLLVPDILKYNISEPFKYFIVDNNSGLMFFNSSDDYYELLNNDRFMDILNDYSVKYYNFVEMMNNYFTDLKATATALKLIGFIIAFIILLLFFNLKKSVYITLSVLFSIILSMSIFSILSIDINIFALFGFILGSAVGIDYAVLMMNNTIERDRRLFGVFTSSITSMISFIILSTSQTYAVFTFGLSVFISLLILTIVIPIIESRLQ